MESINFKFQSWEGTKVGYQLTKEECGNWFELINVITLALGLQPRQRLAKVQAKSEARESHFMLLGECERRRVWGNEPTHYQGSSHFGSWSPHGLPIFQKGDYRGQNSLDWKIPYTIENILDCRCLWARMTHLGT